MAIRFPNTPSPTRPIGTEPQKSVGGGGEVKKAEATPPHADTGKPDALAIAPSDAFTDVLGSLKDAPKPIDGQPLPKNSFLSQQMLRFQKEPTESLGAVEALRGDPPTREYVEKAIKFYERGIFDPPLSPPIREPFLPNLGFELKAERLENPEMRKAFESMKKDGILDSAEAGKLLELADDLGGLDPTMRKDLGRILDGIGLRVTDQAQKILGDKLKGSEEGLDLQTREVADAFRGMLTSGGEVSLEEAMQLIMSVMKAGGKEGGDGFVLTDPQRADLLKLLNQTNFSSLARDAMRKFVGPNAGGELEKQLKEFEGWKMPRVDDRWNNLDNQSWRDRGHLDGGTLVNPDVQKLIDRKPRGGDLKIAPDRNPGHLEGGSEPAAPLDQKRIDLKPRRREEKPVDTVPRSETGELFAWLDEPGGREVRPQLLPNDIFSKVRFESGPDFVGISVKF